MPFKYDDLISRKTEGRAFSYTDTQVMLYALGVGMGRDPLDARELPFVFELPKLRAVPTVVTVLGAAAGGPGVLDGVPIDWPQVLHGEQRISLHRPLPPSADVISDTRIADVIDKGADKGALIFIQTDVRLASGEPLYTSEAVMFCRGDGGCGGPAKSGPPVHRLPERAPDLTQVTETRPDQALLYRLNGDRNPLHADPRFAAQGGFPTPILHGLCSYGVACRAVLASVCDYDDARIKTFDVRFTSPVFPGETIATDIWIDGEVVSFRSRVEARGITSLNNGRCVISS
jgi:acyl dehydratase